MRAQFACFAHKQSSAVSQSLPDPSAPAVELDDGREAEHDTVAGYEAKHRPRGRDSRWRRTLVIFRRAAGTWQFVRTRTRMRCEARPPCHGKLAPSCPDSDRRGFAALCVQGDLTEVGAASFRHLLRRGWSRSVGHAVIVRFRATWVCWVLSRETGYRLGILQPMPCAPARGFIRYPGPLCLRRDCSMRTSLDSQPAGPRPPHAASSTSTQHQGRSATMQRLRATDEPPRPCKVRTRNRTMFAKATDVSDARQLARGRPRREGKLAATPPP